MSDFWKEVFTSTLADYKAACERKANFKEKQMYFSRLDIVLRNMAANTTRIAESTMDQVKVELAKLERGDWK